MYSYLLVIYIWIGITYYLLPFDQVEAALSGHNRGPLLRTLSAPPLKVNTHQQFDHAEGLGVHKPGERWESKVRRQRTRPDKRDFKCVGPQMSWPT